MSARSFLVNRSAPHSISHWGMFVTPTGAGRLIAEDLGIVDNAYVSVFTLGNRSVTSKTTADPEIGAIIGQNGLQELRVATDVSALHSIGIEIDDIVLESWKLL